MKTYSERTSDILKKVEHKNIAHKKTTRSIIGGACALCLFLAATMLFIPYDKTPPAMERYASSEYYNVIEKLNVLTYNAPEYNNAFEQYVLETFGNMFNGGKNDVAGAAPEAEMWEGLTGDGMPEADVEVDMMMGVVGEVSIGDSVNSNESYIETTDNQVKGVIEGDIIKRSDKYIYYLRGMELSVYSIDKENSKELGRFCFEDAKGYKLQPYEGECEMFLSQDCKTVTLITSAYDTENNTKVVVLIALDVSEPTAIKEKTRTYLTGSYLSARMVEDEFLVMAHYYIRQKDIDFDEPETFVPQYGVAEEMTCIDGSNIACPEELSGYNYTVICRVDSSSLKATATGAFLSYADEVYVSEENIFATREYWEKETDEEGYTHNRVMTEITAMNYGSEGLSILGSVSVEGAVKDQYSLDEYQNAEENKHLLRVVTTTDEASYIDEKQIIGELLVQSSSDYKSTTNASLYCIDLNTWQVVASVERFAPENETAESVRFDGNYAYVCTAEVVQMTDPVYFFDLTDLNNITVKDTGTIDGYSSSLVNFGDYLLGIGYGASSDVMKIELYKEEGDKVVSVASYEKVNSSFSTEYKSYLIDRENMRVGIGCEWYGPKENEGKFGLYEDVYHNGYILLQFDGYGFMELVVENIGGINADKRAVIIDEYIYIFGEKFVVQKL